MDPRRAFMGQLASGRSGQDRGSASGTCVSRSNVAATAPQNPLRKTAWRLCSAYWINVGRRHAKDFIGDRISNAASSGACPCGHRKKRGRRERIDHQSRVRTGPRFVLQTCATAPKPAACVSTRRSKNLHKPRMDFGLENVGLYEQRRLGPLCPPSQIPTQTQQKTKLAHFAWAGNASSPSSLSAKPGSESVGKSVLVVWPPEL